MQDMLLMMKDTAVMRINFDYGAFEVLNQQLLPYRLQEKQQTILILEGVELTGEDTKSGTGREDCKTEKRSAEENEPAGLTGHFSPGRLFDCKQPGNDRQDENRGL